MRELDPRLDLDFIISRKTRIGMQTARSHILSKGNCVIASTSVLLTHLECRSSLHNSATADRYVGRGRRKAPSASEVRSGS